MKCEFVTAKDVDLYLIEAGPKASMDASCHLDFFQPQQQRINMYTTFTQDLNRALSRTIRGLSSADKNLFGYSISNAMAWATILATAYIL